MKNDFEAQLEIFSSPDSKLQSLRYLDKYWLHVDDYVQKWQTLQSQVFNADRYFPELVFKQELDVLIVGGGVIFDKEDFEKFKVCLKEVGDEKFAIVQNINKSDPSKVYYLDKGWTEHPLLRFKYPADITWEELLSGGGISDELFKNPYKEYYIFGDKAVWGKYAANDYKYPLDIIGYRKDYENLFKSVFKLSKDEKEEIINFIPLDYQKYI
jgi:hypothetical protein